MAYNVWRFATTSCMCACGRVLTHSDSCPPCLVLLDRGALCLSDNICCYSINAGCTALPALLNIKQVMQQRQVTGIWNGKDELPVSIVCATENHNND
jgi:hypothetical protein